MLNKTTRAILLGTFMAALPAAAMADGHTNAFPGNKGYVGDVSQPRPVTNQRYYGNKYASSRSRLRARAFCPAHFYGMYRGTTYCQNGVALPN